jgi:hypothetical protein
MRVGSLSCWCCIGLLVLAAEARDESVFGGQEGAPIELVEDGEAPLKGDAAICDKTYKAGFLPSIR